MSDYQDGWDAGFAKGWATGMVTEGITAMLAVLDLPDRGGCDAVLPANSRVIATIDGFTGHDMAQAREEGYSAGVQRAAEHEGILLDLIAVLHDEHRPYQGCAHDCCRECATCRESWPCETSKELDRARRRHRELVARMKAHLGEDPPATPAPGLADE